MPRFTNALMHHISITVTLSQILLSCTFHYSKGMATEDYQQDWADFVEVICIH